MSHVSIVMHAQPDTVVTMAARGRHSWLKIAEPQPGGTSIEIFPGAVAAERLDFAKRLLDAAQAWHDRLLLESTNTQVTELVDHSDA